MAPPADLDVVGAGAAGLYAALCAAREGASVTLISGRPLGETASYWAALLEANRPRLSDPDLVQPGQTLHLPAPLARS